MKVRVYGTHPVSSQALQASFRIDTALAHLHRASQGATTEKVVADDFAYQDFFVPGETGVGIQFDLIPPFGFIPPERISTS